MFTDRYIRREIDEKSKNNPFQLLSASERGYWSRRIYGNEKYIEFRLRINRLLDACSEKMLQLRIYWNKNEDKYWKGNEKVKAYVGVFIGILFRLNKFRLEDNMEIVKNFLIGGEKMTGYFLKNSTFFLLWFIEKLPSE